ncbi:MAG TPA: hexose kinase [Longimicrobiales bacterium]
MPERCDVLTITPNPSIDLLHGAGRIVWDDANRVDPPRRRAGGQGVNVARAVRALGGRSHALLPLGGSTGDALATLMTEGGIPFTRSQIDGETRTFFAVTEAETGRSLLVNPRGPLFSPEECAHLRDTAVALIERLRPSWVACCGSLPPGVPPGLYAEIKTAARSHGGRFVADCDGEPLQLAAHGGCDLLTPNRYEAERLTGQRVATVSEAVRAARILVARGTPVVAVTLGGDGAVIVSGNSAAHAAVSVSCDGGSAVGAGDSFLASLLLSLTSHALPDDALRDAVAAGASVLAGRGSDLMNRAAYDALRPLTRITRIE